MLPAPANAPSSAPEPGELLAGYLAALAERGAGNSAFTAGARAFLRRWPDPQAWAAPPLAARMMMWSSTRPLINYLMLLGHLRPGYDYLLDRKLPAVLREAKAGPLAGDLDRFLTAATTLGFTDKTAAGMASQVLMRMLIQTGRGLDELTEADLAEFDRAIGERDDAHARSFKHYRTALAATRTVLHNLGSPVTAPVKNCAHLRWPAGRHFAGVPEPIIASMARYLQCAAGTRPPGTVANIARRLGEFARITAGIDPVLTSLAGLDRQRHVEPYQAATAAAAHPRAGAPLSASERRGRILTVGRMIDEVIEWGWAEAPAHRLIFPLDVPRLPRPLPRYLPADADRRLSAALHASANATPSPNAPASGGPPLSTAGPSSAPSSRNTVNRPATRSPSPAWPCRSSSSATPSRRSPATFNATKNRYDDSPATPAATDRNDARFRARTADDQDRISRLTRGQPSV